VNRAREQCSWPLVNIRALSTERCTHRAENYFGRVEPCLRDDHTFRFDLRFGSYLVPIRASIESQQSPVFFIPYSRQPMRRHSKLREPHWRVATRSLNWPLDAAPLSLSLPHPRHLQRRPFSPTASGVLTVELLSAGNMESLWIRNRDPNSAFANRPVSVGVLMMTCN
jgi:hypothetical protein